MLADSKLFAGGEGAVMRSINNDELSDETVGTVNRLIMSCGTSKESLSTLYGMFKQSIFALAFSITSDYHLSEDCVTETLVRLSQITDFDPKKGDGKGFILTIARNVALELRRRYKRECTDFFIQSYGEADKTVEDSIFINQLLKHLNDKQRQVVVMKCCSDLTFREIAKIMKSPESTVKSRYKKAIAILQEKAGVSSEG